MLGTGPERFPFQKTGASWLCRRDRALLADEQGLGKSVQAIDAADNAGANRILVLCKAVGRQHWVREFDKFSPARRSSQVPRVGEPIRDSVDLTVINYDIAHRKPVLQQLVRQNWDLLICDEMQSLKAGGGSLRGQVVLDRARGLANRCDAVWGLSGTPAPNHAGDLHPWLWGLHGHLVPADYETFLQRYTRYTETPFGYKVYGNRNVQELRDLLADVMLRRTRTEVMPQLPDLRVDHIPLDADVDATLRWLEDHEDVLAIKSVVAGMDPDENPAEAAQAWENDLSSLRRLTGLAKAKPCAELVRQELDGGQEKVVVMGWHPEVLERMAQALCDYNPIVLHGGTPQSEKDSAESDFQDNPKRRVLLGQIQTAGTTITLTRAHRLIFVEPSWVPGENEQAMLRILRIGQDRDCLVSFTALPNTLDDIVTSVFTRKAAMLAEIYNDPSVRNEDRQPQTEAP